jgi:hypothetical protein
MCPPRLGSEPARIKHASEREEVEEHQVAVCSSSWFGGGPQSPVKPTDRTQSGKQATLESA